MRFLVGSLLSAIIINLEFCEAIPLLWSRSKVQLEPRQPQSYSVVAVDGGSRTAAVPAATKTVTDAVTQVQTSVVLATIIATPLNDAVSPQTVTLTQSASVVTVQPSVTPVAYDNGQWHTTYYFKSTIIPSSDVLLASTTSSASSTITPSANIALLAAVSSSSSSVQSIQSVDLGQWAPWASKFGN